MKKKQNNKRRGLSRVLNLILILAVLAVLFVLIVNAVMVITTEGDIYGTDNVPVDDYDCILVLGAGIHKDGSPSDMLADRLITSVKLWNNGVSPVILMSGDHGREEYDEVNNMKMYAVSKGVASDAVFLDHAGFSTYDSLYRAKDVFGAKKVVIVTQKYHLYRALSIARSLGLDAVGVSADLHSYAGQEIREVREVLARTKDIFSTWIKPLPKYLGDPIDLGGSALQTEG